MEKEYISQQIFNCDEKGAPGFKVSKDRLTLLLCANTSGTFKCKPLLVYKSENLRAFKGKKKEHLTVFWCLNKTSWVTQTHFKDWFLQSFIPEVRDYLAKENLPFKVMLLLDNCKSHGDAVMLQYPDVHVEFLPPNTTPLIQPMDHTVIATFKAYYVKRVIQRVLRFVNKHQNCDNFSRNLEIV